DDLFPRKSPFGRAPADLAWSKDGRYLAFVWAPYDTKGGSDLYAYDTQSKVLRRLTSPENMAKFDRKVSLAMVRYKKDAEEDLKVEKMNDLEWREWRLKKKQEDADRKEP